MFRKIFALTLCVALLTAALLPASAETNQLTKLSGQWKSSGFRGTLTGKVTGEKSSLFSDETWAALKRLLTGYTVSLTHTVNNPRVNEGDETIVTLVDAGERELGRINILTDSAGIVYLQSDLLDDAGLYYAYDSGFDWSSLVFASENGWPSLLHVLMEIDGAKASWKEQAQPYYEQFSLNISRWMQNYVTTSAERDVNGNYITTNRYEIPAADVLQETTLMLADLLSNPKLMALLAEVMTAEEQAAYLQTNMMRAFLQMLQNVKVSGSILVTRQYESTSGNVLYDSLSIPCPDNLPVSQLTLVHVPNAEDGELWQLSAALDAQELGIALNQKLNVELTAQNTADDIWTGSLLAVLPGSQEPEALLREDQTVFSVTYNLNLPAPKDTNDYYGSRYERKYEAMLVVKPDEAMALPAFSLGGSLTVYSKSSSAGSPCYVEGEFALTDLEQEGMLGLAFSGRSVQRWTPTLLTDALSAALRMDLMNAPSRLGLLGQLGQHLLSTLNSRIQQ